MGKGKRVVGEGKRVMGCQGRRGGASEGHPGGSRGGERGGVGAGEGDGSWGGGPLNATAGRSTKGHRGSGAAEISVWCGKEGKKTCTQLQPCAWPSIAELILPLFLLPIDLCLLYALPPTDFCLLYSLLPLCAHRLAA